MKKQIKLWLKNKPNPIILYVFEENIQDFTDWFNLNYTEGSSKNSFTFEFGFGKYFQVYSGAIMAYEVDLYEGKDFD